MPSINIKFTFNQFTDIKMAVDQAQLRLAKAEIIKLCEEIKPQAVFVRLAWHDAGTFDVVRLFSLRWMSSPSTWNPSLLEMLSLGTHANTIFLHAVIVFSLVISGYGGT